MTRRLWDGDSDADKESANGNGAASSSEEGLSTESFLDKSFIVRFHVPPLVLSDWRQYLKEQLGVGITGLTEQKINDVVMVYNYWRQNEASSKAKNPTPRELKLFVNQVGAVLRQWGDEFTVSSVAYFVLRRRNTDDLVLTLLKDGALDAIVRLLGDGLKRELAGLVFNVPQTHGFQVLLENPIIEALTKPDSPRLCKLRQDYASGFWAVLWHISPWVEAQSPQR